MPVQFADKIAWPATLHPLLNKEPKVKKLLAAAAILAITASSASAHQATYTFINKAWPGPKVTSIDLTKVIGGGGFAGYFVPPVGPKQSGTFPGFFDPPCDAWVTLHLEGLPDLKSAGIMNVCTQRTITLGGQLGAPNDMITFGP